MFCAKIVTAYEESESQITYEARLRIVSKGQSAVLIIQE